MRIKKSSAEEELFAATIYAEARGEPEEGQIWVAWVIKNRARLNRSYWGGNKIRNVCLHPFQFECWNGKDSISINEPDAYRKALQIARQVQHSHHDPTNGCDHYNNPNKEGYPEWTKNVTLIRKIGEHNFYRS